MGKNPRRKGNEKSSRKKIDTAIVVALIGLCGTVMAALLANPILVAWMPRPVAPTAVPTETPTPSPVVQDWNSILRISFRKERCGSRVLPPTINPGENPSVVSEQFAQAVQNNEDLQWLQMADLEGSGEFDLDVASLVTDAGEIRIGNQILLNVSVQKDLPENINVASYTLCGGEGELRIFPPVTVSNGFDQYQLTSAYPEVPFFTLQPGEFEEFRVPFQCEGFGIYHFNVNVSYEYPTLGWSGITDSAETISYTCPETYTFWQFDPHTYQVLSYAVFRWNGTRYEVTP